MAIGPDRVQVLKQESSSGGGNAGDAVVYPDPINEQQDVLSSAGAYVQSPTEAVDEAVSYYRHQGELYLKDQANPARSLSQLFGLAQRNCYTEITRTSGLVTSVIVYADATKAITLEEATMTYSSGLLSSVVEKHHDRTGALVATYTTTITRSGGLMISATTVET